MKYILFPEGRILNNNGAFEYEYHLKDHLGSVRVAFVPTVNGKEVVQENAYYPFGATIGDLSYAAPLNNNRYGYTGQEQLNDFNLNWYDYIARNYNPLIGRFNSIDPLAEKYYGISPYAYCNNNPVRYTDPTGKFPIETIWDIGNVLYDFGAAVVNHIKGDHQAAKSNWVDLGLDAGAMLIPYVPAGATKALKATDKAIDATKAVDKATDAAKVGKYSDIPNPKNVGDGKATTSSQRKNILEENKKQNNGELRSDGDGRKLNPPSKNVKGQKADMNQAEVDHINPKSKGGSNDNSNLQVLSKEENLRKGNR